MFLFCFSLFLTIYAQFEWISEDNCDRSQGANNFVSILQLICSPSVCDIAILVCPYGYTCSSMDEIDGIGFCCRDRRGFHLLQLHLLIIAFQFFLLLLSINVMICPFQEELVNVKQRVGCAEYRSTMRSNIVRY